MMSKLHQMMVLFAKLTWYLGNFQNLHVLRFMLIRHFHLIIFVNSNMKPIGNLLECFADVHSKVQIMWVV